MAHAGQSYQNTDVSSAAASGSSSTKQLENCATDFHSMWYWRVSLKVVDTLQLPLKYDNNNKYFDMNTCSQFIRLSRITRKTFIVARKTNVFRTEIVERILQYIISVNSSQNNTANKQHTNACITNTFVI